MPTMTIESITSPMLNPLSTEDLDAQARRLAMSLQTLEVFATTIRAQPVLEPSLLPGSRVLPDLNAHLRLAKPNATAYLDNTVPSIIDALTAILGFGSIYGGSQGILLELLPKINTDENARTAFLRLLEALEDEARSRQTRAMDLATALSVLDQQLRLINENFDEDLKDAEQEVLASDARLASLDQEILDAQGRLHAATAETVGAAFTLVGALVLITIGNLATFGTASIGTGLVVAGAAGAVTSTGITIAAATGLDNAATDLERLYREVETINVELSLIRAVEDQTQTLQLASGQTLPAVHGLQVCWTNIADRIRRFRDDLAEARDEIDIPSIEGALKVAEEDWSRLSTTVTEVLLRINSIRPEIDLESLESAG